MVYRVAIVDEVRTRIWGAAPNGVRFNGAPMWHRISRLKKYQATFPHVEWTDAVRAALMARLGASTTQETNSNGRPEEGLS